MKKTKTLLSIFLLIIFYLSAAASLLAKDNETSIFWEITGSGLNQPSYLYGTVHMIAQSDFFLPEGLDSVFKNAEQIVLEIDMDEPNFMKKAERAMFMPLKSLKELTTEKEYKIIKEFFEDSLGLPLNKFHQIKPVFLAQFILPKIVNEPLTSYEIAFLQMAKGQKKELIGIETIEEQIETLDKIPFERQAEMIVETIVDFDEGKVIYSQLIEAYKNMDFKNFYELMFKISKEFKEFEQLLLIDRNLKWIPIIENIIKEKSSFIAVGALHLEGENGLVELLKSKGYKLKALNKNNFN